MNDRPMDPSGEDMLDQASIDPAIGEILVWIREHGVWTPTTAEQASHVAGAARVAFDLRPTAVGRTTPTTRSEPMIARLLSSRLAKVAAAALLVLFATGGMAYAGVLPDPIRDVVSDLARVLGVEIDDDLAEESATSDEDVIEIGTESDEEDDDLETDDAVLIVDDEADDASDEVDDVDDDETEDDDEDDEGDDDEDEDDDSGDDSDD